MKIWPPDYNKPWTRILRRFVVAGIGAAAPFLAMKLTLTPEAFIDSIIALSTADWLMAGKMFIGAGILLGLDKVKNEWRNL